MDTGNLGKLIILCGLVMILFGGILLFAQKIPWFGRLPGDIFIQKKNISIYIPITTSIVISIVLTLIFYLISKR